MRDLPWGNITGGSPKQFEDRVREKKRSWTPEKLCVGIPDAFKVLLSHARQLKFDDDPDYDGLQNAFMEDMKDRGYPLDIPFDWSDAGDANGAICYVTIPNVYVAKAFFRQILPPLSRRKLALPGQWMRAHLICLM